MMQNDVTKSPIIVKYKIWKSNNEKRLKEVMADKSLAPDVRKEKIKHIKEIIENLDQGIERQKNQIGRTR